MSGTSYLFSTPKSKLRLNLICSFQKFHQPGSVSQTFEHIMITIITIIDAILLMAYMLHAEQGRNLIWVPIQRRNALTMM